MSIPKHPKVHPQWQSKVDSLIRLAIDQKGKPEGDLARAKLAEIIKKHPRYAEYQPVHDFMLSDIPRMHRMGISTDGLWVGRNMQEAIQNMVADYQSRLAERRTAILARTAEKELEVMKQKLLVRVNR